MLDTESAKPNLDVRQFYLLNHELDRIYKRVPDPYDKSEKTKKMI